MVRRGVAILILATSLVLVTSPSWAKDQFEVVFSGGGLKHPVMLLSDAILQEMPLGGDTVWTTQSWVPPLTGPRYTMDFYDTWDGARHYTGRWWYYPEAGGALFARPGPASSDGEPDRWATFSPAFQRFVNDALRAQPWSLARWAVAALLAGVLAASAYMLAGWMDRRFPRGFPRRAAA